MRRFDVIVAGAGGMGTAAAAHLSRRGVGVLALDRFPPGHGRGSSHGQTRLIRLAYFEHPDYVPLLRRARDLWQELERETVARLLTECGLLSSGPADGPVVAGTLRSARDHGLAVEPMTGRDAAARWPAFAIPDDWTAVFERDAGHLAVEACVRAHADVALRHGAAIEADHEIRGWRVDGDSVVVETSRETLSCGRLVLCPGPWAAGLLHPRGFFYGFPMLDDRGIKFAEHTGGREVADPLTVDRRIDDAEQAAIETALAAHLPGVGTVRTAHEVCLYTMSPDHHFVVGLHPAHPQVAIAAGFSGHGFKFASVIGEVLADLALTGSTPQPVNFLSPARFASRRQSPTP